MICGVPGNPCGFFDPRKEVRGYSQAAALLEELRNDSLLDLGETLCGFPVKALNGRHLLWLQLVDSPFMYKLTVEELCAQPGIHADIARFVRIVADRYSVTQRRWRAPWLPTFGRWLFFWRYRRILYRSRLKFSWRKWLFSRRYRDLRHRRKLKLNIMVSRILTWIDESLHDLKSGGGGFHTDYCVGAVLVHALCHSYGCSPMPDADNSALNVPLKIAGQLFRVQTRMNNPKATLHNRTDDLLAQYLNDVNRTNGFVNGVKHRN